MSGDDELEFLTNFAVRMGFVGKRKIVFVQRFQERNDDLNNKELADVLTKELTEKLKEGADPSTILRDHLRVICDKLEDEGFSYQGNDNGRWKDAKAWLRQKFLEWLREQQSATKFPHPRQELWQQIVDRGSYTYQMGPVVVEPEAPRVPTMGMTRQPGPFVKTVPLDSEIEFHVKLEQEGYLTLLEREPTGTVCCLCPSEYAPEQHWAEELRVLPQSPPSPYRHFVVNELGCEQLVGIITQELPKLKWLAESHKEVLELGREHLKELLKYLEQSQDAQVVWMQYTVTPE